MPKKVSPEYFIQLSQRVNTLHKEKKERFIGALVKQTGRYRNDYYSVLSPSEKDMKAYC